MSPIATKRRIFASIGAAAVAASALSGCAAGGSPSEDDQITILSGWQVGDATGDFLSAAVADFTEDTGIKVNVETVAFEDLRTTVETASVAGQMPDLITLNFTPEVKPWLDNGLIADVTPYLDEWGISDILLPGVVDPWWTYDGKVGGFPYQSGSWPVWYNTDLLAQAGIDSIPTTVDELVVAATALRDAGIEPFCFPGKDWGGGGQFWLWAQLFTGDRIADIMANGGFADDPDALKGIELLGELRDGEVFIQDAAGYAYDDCVNAYDEGKVAIAHFGSWGFTALGEEVTAATTVAGLPLPDGAAYDKPILFPIGGNGLMLSQNAADDEAKLSLVKQFIDFLYAPEQLQAWVGESNQISSVQAAVIGDVEWSNPLLQQNATITDNNDLATIHDLYVKAGVDITPEVTWFIGTPGATAEEFAARLDQLWQG